jgi:tRNA modification GTPase
MRDKRCGGKHWYQKTFEKIEQAQLVIYLMDSLKFQVSGSESIIEIEKLKTNILKQILIVANKIDQLTRLQILQQELQPLKATIF